jgi:hypothetical protein
MRQSVLAMEELVLGCALLAAFSSLVLRCMSRPAPRSIGGIGRDSIPQGAQGGPSGHEMTALADRPSPVTTPTPPPVDTDRLLGHTTPPASTPPLSPADPTGLPLSDVYVDTTAIFLQR